jgi:hypothetical protein
MRITYQYGGKTGGGGEADSDDAVITDGRYYAEGGEFPFRPPGPPTKEEAKFLRQQEAVDEGLRAFMQKALRSRDKVADKNDLPYETMSSVLLDLINSGQLNREDALRKGKRRRFARQAAPLLGEAALATALGAGTLQNQHERQTGYRPNFGQALRMIFGGQ